MCAACAAATVMANPPKSNGIPEAARPDIAESVARAAAKPHPRLFADAAGFAALRARLGKEELLTAGAEFIRATADPILSAKPCERIKEGKRGDCRQVRVLIADARDARPYLKGARKARPYLKGARKARSYRKVIVRESGVSPSVKTMWRAVAGMRSPARSGHSTRRTALRAR